MSSLVAFNGTVLDLDACEALLHTRWSAAALKHEPKLFRTKWFGVRHLHPVQATYLMGDCFTNETRRIIRSHIDNTPPGEGRDWHPIKSGDILAPPASERSSAFWKRKIGALIKARQWADEHGMPYDFLVGRALKHHYFGRSYFLEQRALPDPMMLNGEQVRNHLLIAWVEELDARIQFSDHPRYKIPNHIGHPDEIDHQTWLTQQIQRRSMPVYSIKRFIKADLLRPEVAQAAFGSDLVRHAISK